MSISSDDLDNIPKECSDEEDLQIQLNNKIYINIWKYVDEETYKCSQYPIQFKPTAATTSIHTHGNKGIIYYYKKKN
ncbi:5882_t:CDS:2 [Gigaspora rosea]|nr:5882_t:CDS:2 [Gigaspora rosea]